MVHHQQNTNDDGVLQSFNLGRLDISYMYKINLNLTHVEVTDAIAMYTHTDNTVGSSTVSK